MNASDPRRAGLAPDDAALWDQLGDALPAFSTLPTPGALHDLDQVRLVGKAMGRPNMPWQDWASRIMTERRLDDPRQFRYKLVILTIPRQAGKTTLLGNVLTTRALTNRGRRAFYTAQTGKDATARWKDLAEAIGSSPIGNHVTLRRAIGSQSLTFPNGSFIQPFAPTPKSLHGYTPHDVGIDECFAFDGAQGNDLMGAIGPAQVTLADRQLLLISTAGTADSVFLKEWVEAGRLAVDDPASSIAYLEWSQPAGLDPDNPEHWGFHPALGHTVTLDSLIELHAQHESSPGEWRRAFMNLWTTASESLFDMDGFRARAGDQLPPERTADVTVGYEVAMDRSRAAVYAAWIDPGTGQPAVRHLKVAGGDEWVADYVLHVRDTLGPRTIGADDGGPTRTVTDQLRKTAAGAPWLEILGPRDLATGWDQFKSRIRRGTLTYDGDPGLEAVGLAAAAEVVTERTMGQGYAPDRMKSRGPIPELVAATVALRLLENGAAPAPAPAFRF